VGGWVSFAIETCGYSLYFWTNPRSSDQGFVGLCTLFRYHEFTMITKPKPKRDCPSTAWCTFAQ